LDYEIVIIGASSSGLFAAEKLASAGFQVCVFEREKQLNPSRRTYIITPHLADVLGNIPDAIVLNRISTMVVETSKADVEIHLNQPDLIIERNQLIQMLYKRATSAGADIKFGYRFLGFDELEGSTYLSLKKSNGDILQVNTQTLIGADGVFSHVAKEASIDLPTSVPLVQAEVSLPEDWDPGVVKTWFDVAETEYFYWLIPESDKLAVVGLIANEKTDARKVLDRFMEKYGFKAQAYQAGQAALHFPGFKPWGKVGDLLVLLIGDAAGQVKVSTVGGNVTGFMGANAAVKTIILNSNYRRELRSLKRELDLHWFIRYMLERLENPGYDYLVKCITPSVRRFLGSRNRDQMVGGFWQLPFREPRMLILGAQILFKLLRQLLPRSKQFYIEPDIGD